MKALVKTGPGEEGTRLLDWEAPTIVHGDDVLIKNEWVGICRTDIGIYRDTVEHKVPVILGHELAGVVTEVGNEVIGLKAGDRVTAETSVVTCGKCKNCLNGHYNVCKERLGMGRTYHGAFREKICLNYRLVHKLPGGVSTKEAALCEPAAVSYHAVVQRADVKPSENVYVFGPGTIGILIAQISRIMGAKVTVFGLPVDHEKLMLCESFGCKTEIIAPDKKLEATEEVDVVFECSGGDGVARSGLELLRPRGRYVQLGLFKKDQALPMNIITARELTLLGCYSTVSSDFKNVLELLQQGKLDLKSMISRDFSLEDWKSAFKYADDNSSIKILIHP